MRPRRRVAAVALVMLVIAVHLFVTQRVAQRMADFATQRAMPPRISVTYVRELELAPPPVAAPVVVAPAPPRRRAAAAPAPAGPASAPVAAEAEPAPKIEPASPAVAEAPPASVPATEQASAEPAAAAASAAEAFQWPTSTRLTYELTGNYRGEINGDAQVEWVRVGTHYQVHVDVRLGPLISRRMSSEGELVGDRLLPSRYDEVTEVLFRQPRRVTILLGPEEILLATGTRVERTAGVQDAASQFIQLTAMFTTRPELLQAGNSIEVVLALRNRVGSWIYDTLGEEEIATPIGPLATYHVKPRRVISSGNELSAEIWFSPQLRYLPVRLRISQDAETFVDLVLSRRPEIAEQ
jgi:hypothetical protein